MKAEIIEVIILERFECGPNHFVAVRRGEDLDVKLARQLSNGFPNFFLRRVVDAVFDFVDE